MRLERGVKFFLIALGASAALLASATFGQGSLNAAGQATPARPPAGPPQAQPVKWEKGAQPAMLLPKSDVNPTVLLWPQGAPGSEGKTDDETYRLVDDQMVISNVHRPSITVYLPPKDKATGAGIIVMPGGASRELWINKEGYRVAQWLSQRGIAAFVLKYRLPRGAAARGCGAGLVGFGVGKALGAAVRAATRSANRAAQAGQSLSPKIQRQMTQRGWTEAQIREAIRQGKDFPAINKVNGNSATRYVHPTTGQSVVVDNITGEVIHVGGPGFLY